MSVRPVLEVVPPSTVGTKLAELLEKRSEDIERFERLTDALHELRIAVDTQQFAKIGWAVDQLYRIAGINP